MKNPLDALSDEDVRRICEDGLEWQNEVEPILRGSTSGIIKCPDCQADMKWSRQGGHFKMTCDLCGWNAAGCFGDLERANRS